MTSALGSSAVGSGAVGSSAAGARIALEHVCYWYPAWAGPPVLALSDINLELGPGLTVLGGDSGAGKSTLLRVLNGLVPHFYGGRFAGRATVAGLDIATTATRVMAGHIGLVFQEFQAGFVRATVAREVAFAPENLGLPRQRIAGLVEGALDQVGIAPLANRRISTLSGGERQRVALAAVLAGAPGIVALDEPTSQLDDEGAARLAAVLGRLASAGHTVVVAEPRAHRLAYPPGRGAAPGRPRAVRSLDLVGAGLVASPPPTAPSAPSAPSHIPTPATGPESWALHGVTAGVGGQAVVTGVELCGAGGEILVLVGANGAGKTTLLRTIAGLLAPMAGRVERRPERIAYLPQDPGALLHRRSVLAEVAQTLRWCRSQEDPMAVLEALGLAELAGRDPRDLSGGQRQRAALATVLVGRPALVLLDEPTRGMDRATRRALGAVLRARADDGGSVVVATHDVELATDIGDRVVSVASGGVRVLETDSQVAP